MEHNNLTSTKKLIGKEVYHKEFISYGAGKIIAMANGTVYVKFSCDENIRMFSETDLLEGILYMEEDEINPTNFFSKAEYKVLVPLFNKLKADYGFEGFVHYTDYRNLKSIMDYGYLLSREELISKGLAWTDRGEKSVLEGTESDVKSKVRLLYRCNTPISYRFEEKAKAENSEMVVLIFHPNLLLNHEVFFFEASAARSAYGKPTRDVNEIKNFNWEMIFSSGPMNNDQDKREIIRYRDAEVLVSGRLGLENLRKIYFKSDNCLEKARREIGDNIKCYKGITGEKGQFSL